MAVTVTPVDDGRVLDNPGMGWTFQYYSNDPFQYGSFVEPGDSLDWFPGCNVCYLRIPWAYVEPEEGVYNWAALDTPAQRWIDRGGKVAFRITCCESWLEYATPKWVFDAGAKGVRFNHGWGPDGGPNPEGKCVAPDYVDPIFLSKLQDFMMKFAARYDGRPEVAFVDLGSFGCWGEAHTGSSSRLECDEQERQVRVHMRLLKKCFKQTQLVATHHTCAHPGGEVNGGTCSNQLWQIANGIAWRDDGIMCQPPPASFFRPKSAQAFWPTLPVVLETEHYSSSVARGAWSGETLEKAVEAHHASYLGIHGDPASIYNENSNAVARINRRLGYRFNPVRITWPDAVKVGVRGEPFEVTWTWRNVGVAPSYRDFYPALTVKNDRGEIMAVLADADFNLRELSVGEPGQTPQKHHAMRHLLGRWKAPTFVAGEYDVYVSVGECDGTPVVELPLADSDGKRRYRVGRIRFVTDEMVKSAYSPRMDRTKLQIGAYCLAPHERDEAHVKDLKECGIDFLYGIPLKDRQTLDLFARYGLGCIAVGAVPFWNGADGSRAGQMATVCPLEMFASQAAEAEDHPAVWAVDFCDEPSALDFPHIAKAVEKMKGLFPKAIPYVNLYPNYASVVQNTGLQTVNQLGTATYAEHVSQYVRQVPLDYISFDFYVYSTPPGQRPEFLAKYYDNLRVVADACRGSGKSLWFIPQVNSRFGDLWLSANMLRFQAWTAMAFGAEVINWACWGIEARPDHWDMPGLHGWWTNNVLTVSGEKTEQYDKLREVNAEIRRLGVLYMRYRSVATHFVGGRDGLASLQLPNISDLRSESGSELVVGEMSLRSGGEGTAAFVVAIDDPFDQRSQCHRLLFKPNARVRVHGPNGEQRVEELPDGSKAVPIVSNSAVMIEVVE